MGERFDAPLDRLAIGRFPDRDEVGAILLDGDAQRFGVAHCFIAAAEVEKQRRLGSQRVRPLVAFDGELEVTALVGGARLGGQNDRIGIRANRGRGVPKERQRRKQERGCEAQAACHIAKAITSAAGARDPRGTLVA
jgi:hypothetical protein